MPLYTLTAEPASLVPVRTSAVSSVVSPEVRGPVTLPTSSVGAVKFAVGLVVKRMSSSPSLSVSCVISCDKLSCSSPSLLVSLFSSIASALGPCSSVVGGNETPDTSGDFSGPPEKKLPCSDKIGAENFRVTTPFSELSSVPD